MSLICGAHFHLRTPHLRLFCMWPHSPQYEVARPHFHCRTRRSWWMYKDTSSLNSLCRCSGSSHLPPHRGAWRGCGALLPSRGARYMYVLLRLAGRLLFTSCRHEGHGVCQDNRKDLYIVFYAKDADHGVSSSASALLLSSSTFSAPPWVPIVRKEARMTLAPQLAVANQNTAEYGCVATSFL